MWTHRLRDGADPVAMAREIERLRAVVRALVEISSLSRDAKRALLAKTEKDDSTEER